MASSLLGTCDEKVGLSAGPAWLDDALASAGACAWRCESGDGPLLLGGGAAALLGAAPANLPEMEKLILEEDREPRRRALGRALERGESWACSFRLARDGERRWIEERGSARAGPSGGLAGAAALLVDVTGRHELEAGLELRLRSESRGRHAAQVATGTAEAALRALARSEAFLESIFSSMADGLMLFAPDGRITRMNPSAREMLGFGPAEVNQPISERMTRVRVLDASGQEVPLERLPVVAALRGESMRGQAYCLDLPDGRKVWTVIGAAPILAPGGGVTGAVLTLGDVSRLRAVQEEREDVSRMISHDLRAPLGIVLAQARLIGRRNEGLDAVRARAEAIATSAQRMASMLNDLVESALIEAGKLHLEKEPVDLGALVRDLRARLAAPYDGERIRVEVTPELSSVVADSNRLERVLMNLLTNALKYSAPGSAVVVRLSCDATDAGIEVEDEGQGIAVEDLPHLFERYFRAVGTSRHEGMGLGLYTARRLVEAHGGTIGVTSVAGKGSLFRVRLPRG
ncbi:MAG TPA: ATP-binding protein [Anaeromyxobacteraceae bacterium]|nr:ATP-binding protein [Anaeromyxobacteraceae bacterium]